MICPACKNDAIIDYVVWEGKEKDSKPVSVEINCPECNRKHIGLSQVKIKINSNECETKTWYPKSKIVSKQKTEVKFYYELFTNRNLKALSLLLDSISKIKIEN